VISYRLPEPNGWRHGVGWRTRREEDGWTVQRWTGEPDWETVATGLRTYADARHADEAKGVSTHGRGL
jgi:hypothetical protein